MTAYIVQVGHLTKSFVYRYVAGVARKCDRIHVKRWVRKGKAKISSHIGNRVGRGAFGEK